MPKSPGVQDLKASFEAKAAHLANMAVPNLKQLTDHSPVEPIVRPSPAPRQAATSNTTPSWIGPVPQGKNNPLGSSAMLSHVTVEFASPGLQPPVYICSSLTDPKWRIIEMDRARNEHGEYRFSKSFFVEEGEYQYKIRLGPGDWWAIDDSKPTVDDGMGNKNNLIVVKQESNKPVDTPVPTSSQNVSKPQPVVPPPADTVHMPAGKPEEPNTAPATKPDAPAAAPSITPVTLTTAVPTASDAKPVDHANDQVVKPHAPAAETSIVPATPAVSDANPPEHANDPVMKPPAPVAGPVITPAIPTTSGARPPEYANDPAMNPPAPVAEASITPAIPTASDTKPPEHANDLAMKLHDSVAEPLVVPGISTVPETRPHENADEATLKPHVPVAETSIVPVVPTVLDTTSPEHVSDSATKPHDPAAEPSTVPVLPTMPETRPPGHAKDERERPPLLPHETVVPGSLEQCQAPLFRHENTAIDNMQHELAHVEIVLFGGSEPPVAQAAVVSPEKSPETLALPKFPTDTRAIHDEIAKLTGHVSPDTPSLNAASPDPRALTGSDDQLRIVSEEEDDGSQKQDKPRNQSYGTFDSAIISQGQMTPPLTPKADSRNGMDRSEGDAARYQTGGSKSESAHASLVSIALVIIGFVVASVTIVYGLFFVGHDNSAAVVE